MTVNHCTLQGLIRSPVPDTPDTPTYHWPESRGWCGKVPNEWSVNQRQIQEPVYLSATPVSDRVWERKRRPGEKQTPKPGGDVYLVMACIQSELRM